jgi:hypothetical protein
MKKKFLMLLISLLPLVGFSQYPWSYTWGLLEQTHAIFIPDTLKLSINQTLEVNDMIGVFYDSSGTLACGGVRIWDGNPTGMLAQADNVNIPGKTGFYEGDIFHWKLYKFNTGQVYDLEFGYMDSIINYPNIQDEEYFRFNGMSALNNDKAYISPFNIKPKKPSILPYSNLSGVIIPEPRTEGLYIHNRKLYYKLK